MRASKSSFTMVLIRSSTSFTISSRVLFRMVAFPPFISRFFWEGYHAALWTQFLGHYRLPTLPPYTIAGTLPIFEAKLVCFHNLFVK